MRVIKLIRLNSTFLYYTPPLLPSFCTESHALGSIWCWSLTGFDFWFGFVGACSVCSGSWFCLTSLGSFWKSLLYFFLGIFCLSLIICFFLFDLMWVWLGFLLMLGWVWCVGWNVGKSLEDLYSIDSKLYPYPTSLHLCIDRTFLDR